MIPHGVEIFVGLDPIDLRWSFDRLSGVVAERIGREAPAANDAGEPPAREKRKPSGRRDLRDLRLPVERLEQLEELFEKLVREGKAERIGFEESRKVAWQRGGARVLVIARAKYRTVDARGGSMIETTPMAPECFPRSLAAIQHQPLGDAALRAELPFAAVRALAAIDREAPHALIMRIVTGRGAAARAGSGLVVQGAPPSRPSTM